MAARVVVPLVLCLAFLATRLVNLDYDGPLYSETHYNSWLDTFVYSLRALNWYNWSYYADSYKDILNANIPALYISNTITYLTMLAFGDNFYGYRLGAVLVSLAASALIGVVLYRSHGWVAALVAFLYLTLDYNFFIASREVEPTTFRIFEVALSLYLFTLIIRRDRTISAMRIVLVSFLGFALVLLEYPTSLFVPSAMVAAVAALRIRSVEDFCTVAGAAVIGLILAFCLYLAVVWATGGSLAVLSGMGSIWGPRVSNSASFAVTVMRNLRAIPKAMFLSYVPFIWYLFVASIGYVLLRSAGAAFAGSRLVPSRLSGAPIAGLLAGKANYSDVLVAFLILFLLLQTLFINDFPLRKQVIWLPIFAYCLAVATADIASLVSLRLRWVGAAVAAAPVVYLAAFSVPKILDKAVFRPTFTHKEAMLSLKQYDGQYFVGYYSLGFTLYNNILPIGNLYMYPREEYPIQFRKPVLDLIDGSVPDSPNFTIAKQSERLETKGFEKKRLVLAPREKAYSPIWLFERP